MKNELPEFTKSMKKTHTILLPEMLEFHFGLLKCAFISSGYKMEVLDSDEKTAREYGLKYANNDICYPAVLIIGQMIAALESGKYDPHKVALMIPQAGGSCRAGNYFHLIRKAIVNAGYWFVPVISLNIGGKEKNPGFTITIGLFRAAKAAIFYGDVLQKMYFQTLPYEQNSGESKRLLHRFYDELSQQILHKKYGNKLIYSNCKKIISAFSLIEKSAVKYKKSALQGSYT